MLVCCENADLVGVLPDYDDSAPLVLHWRIARALRSDLLGWL
jgi:hypothetical protein